LQHLFSPGYGRIDLAVSIFDIQPWGRAPTPLLPEVIVAVIGHLPAPSSLRKVLGEQATLGILNQHLWQEVDSVDKHCLQDLVRKVGPRLLALSHLPVLSGEPLNQQIQYLPLSTRTRTCVRKHQDQLIWHPLTIADVLSVPRMGHSCAIEFLSVVEAAGEFLLAGAAKDPQTGQRPRTAALLTEQIDSAFRMLAAYAAGEQNLETLEAVLPAAREDWPPEIKQQWAWIRNGGARDLAGDLADRYSVPALMSRALGGVNDRSREILLKRTLSSGEAVNLKVLGRHYGVSRERVRQVEKKALASLNQLKTSHYGSVLRRAQVVREKLGVGVPAGDRLIREVLDESTKDMEGLPAGFARAVMLWLAGPYRKSRDWLRAEENLEQSTKEALLGRRNERGVVTAAVVNETLSQFGFNEGFHDAWIARLDHFTPVEEGYICITGNIPDRARALLRYHDRPVSVEEMVAVLGVTSVRSFRQRLIADPGCWRINKQSDFVLAGAAGYEEYTGITGAIMRELEAGEGRVPYAQLVEKLARVHGVKPGSVAAYIHTPFFEKDANGVVRVRDTGDFTVSTDLDNTAACYQDGDGTWYWRVAVKKNLVRGSGCSVPNAFSREIGCNIGEKIEADTVVGPLTFSWPLTSLLGASIGSLRLAAASCQAEEGDFLFVRATKPVITFRRLGQEAVDAAGTDLIRLSLLMGCVEVDNESDALAGIASVLKISSTSAGQTLFEAQRRLKERGESGLAALLPSPNLSIDDYMASRDRP